MSVTMMILVFLWSPHSSYYDHIKAIIKTKAKQSKTEQNPNPKPQIQPTQPLHFFILWNFF